jgi:thioredoxin 1
MTDETFAVEGGQDGVVVLDFWSESCMPCRQVSRILAELEAGAPPGVRILGVDVEENPALVDRFDIQSVPTVLVLREGEVRERFVGVERPQVLRKAIERHAVADPGGEP